MKLLDRERARAILLGENGLSPVSADLILKNYPALDASLAAAVEQWMANGVVTDVQVEGISINDLMRVRRCHFLVAVKDLGRLSDPGLSREQRQRLRQILNKPIIIQ